jgi:hypothetical protein
MSDLGRLLILVGLAVAAAGLVVLLAGRTPFVGHLPGDILWRRGGATIYFPIATSLLLSLLLTVLLNVAGLIFRH